MRTNLKAYAAYLAASLAVLLPLWRPGYVLTLDLIFTRRMPLPTELSSSYLLRLALHYLSIVVPGQILEKLLLLGILLLSSIGLHRLVRALQPPAAVNQWGIYVASIFYAINPFTYARFMAGQYNVLLGYALLPWFVRLLFLFGKRPGWRSAAKLGGLAAVIGVVSIHTVGMLAVLCAAGAAVGWWRHSKNIKRYAVFSLAALEIFVLASSYWLVPLLAGQGSTAHDINNFSAGDTQAFATDGSNVVVKFANVMRLQGFWAESKNLFLLPQDRMILWGTLALAVIALATTGGVVLWKRSRSATLVLGVSALLAVACACGALGLLGSHVSLLAGYREPHKFVALLALAYAVFLAGGVDDVLARLQANRPAAYVPVAVGLLLLPLLLTRVMFWGFDGQLSPRQYPADWTAANQLLQQDKSNFKVLFLPWHQYMTFRFTGRVVANPAPYFFSKPTLVSADPELGKAAGLGQDEQHKKLTALMAQAGERSDLAPQLANQNIKYILLAKDLDFTHYGYVTHQPGIRQLRDLPDLQVYENLAWRAP